MSPTGQDNAMPSGPSPSHRVPWGVAGAIGLAGALGVATFMVFPGASASPSDKVTICHATASTSNPYIVNTISTSSVDEVGNKYLNGHGDHTGPVFGPGSTSGWGDIIPPFTDARSGVTFPGYNWTSAGEAIFNAGCTYVSPSPTPTPTESTGSPTPTPTESTSSPTPTPTAVQVTICHATASTSNPYTANTLDSSSIDEEGNEYLNGHGDHIGAVFTPGMTSGWGDIIPPFTFGDLAFSGYNWTPAGQAIWENQCTYTTPSPTPTPTETSGSPTPTPTSSSPTPTPITTSPAPITTSPAPITTSPAPITTSPAPITTSPAPITTSPAPITTSPAPITTSPAPTSSGSPTPITTPSMDGTPTPPAPATTDNPNPSGGLPNAVPAGGGPGDIPPTKPGWLWFVAAAFLALLIASLRQLLPGRDIR